MLKQVLALYEHGGKSYDVAAKADYIDVYNGGISFCASGSVQLLRLQKVAMPMKLP